MPAAVHCAGWNTQDVPALERCMYGHMQDSPPAEELRSGQGLLLILMRVIKTRGWAKVWLRRDKTAVRGMGGEWEAGRQAGLRPRCFRATSPPHPTSRAVSLTHSEKTPKPGDRFGEGGPSVRISLDVACLLSSFAQILGCDVQRGAPIPHPTVFGKNSPFFVSEHRQLRTLGQSSHGLGIKVGGRFPFRGHTLSFPTTNPQPPGGREGSHLDADSPIFELLRRLAEEVLEPDAWISGSSNSMPGHANPNVKAREMDLTSLGTSTGPAPSIRPRKRYHERAPPKERA